MAPKGLRFILALAFCLHLVCANIETPSSAPPPPVPSPTIPPSPSPSPTPTLSGCQVCATAGDCAHAYLDGPGQFCGNWLDQLSQRQRCCCPRDAVCKLSNYACKCSKTRLTTGPPATSTPRTRSSNSSSLGVGLVVCLALLVSCCVGAACCCVRRAGASQPTRLFFGASGPMAMYDVLPAAKHGGGRAGGVVYAQPAPAYQTNPYAMASMAPAYHPAYAPNPAYGYASGPAYGYGPGHSSGGAGSALAAGGLGVVAGLATGVVVANSFGHHHHHDQYYSGEGGGGGGRGGTGGGRGGEGDSSGGGGGGDYGGDSGDFGGDF